ncbi:helix-turn-helix domain-containing protein [Lentiprolixibacter aurantiacus]|uniref:Helix-turn-helix domain-containing protein n=1 Tax=Lentiprolixibacter aurantiacus TaxID=2993939 RepID=A0AAE3MLH5_9FLAO|nr:helix-turn-helix domain-containing protein [Lentiprolixibacter aurantiacus]
MITIVQAWYFSGTIWLANKNKKTSDLIMIGWLLVIGIHALFSFLQISDFRVNTYISFINSSIPFLQGPFLFLYICAHRNEAFTLKWSHALHAIPFVGLFAYQSYSYIKTLIAAQGEEQIVYVHFLEGINYIQLFFVGLLTIYLVSSYILTRDKQFYAKNKLTWIRTFIAFVGSIWLLALLSIFTPSSVDHSIQSGLSLGIFVMLTGVVYLSSYFGIRESVKTDVPKVFAPKYEKSLLSTEESLEVWTKLEGHMHKTKAFINQELSLNDLSVQLNIPVNKLSQAINRHAEMKYTDYINRYRVDQVKELMSDPKYGHLSILGMALESGFTSKATFNRAFKKFTNETPSQYMSSINL